MEEGKAMDALVAEKAMGWHIDADDDPWWRTPDGDAVLSDHKDETFICAHWYNDRRGHMHNEWAPSTDIADAWLVVEKLNIVVFPMELSHGLSEPHERGYGAFQGQSDLTICTDNLVVELYTEDAVWAPTAPMAISLAALKSVGVDVSVKEPE